ncbi:cell division protein ZipA [Thiohalophilus sp.]|uniref:cell division protein ZipA n=1 Tax=Thiohalophilus sp. TaxID=3028392 RepID=UPI002ACDF4F8|nr:cell division protein ZipA [Thiohalophilus sp.]MDZ7804648.1 cell division protein ZipA [Thiohalophilus sp.]
MDPLRLTLLAIGVAFVAIFYLVMRLRSGQRLRWPGFLRLPRLSLPTFGRHRVNDSDDVNTTASRDNYYDDLDDEDLQALSQMSWHARRDDDVDVASLSGLSAVDAEEDDGESLVIVLNVMAKAGRQFAGMDILDALYANDLRHGEMMIFHRYPEQGGGRPVFSLANTVEPGTFDLHAIEQLQTPGVSLFMQLPAPIDSREAFELMLKTGRNLAEQLGGDLCDERRNLLTLQTIGHLKEQIESFLFRRKMAGLQKQRPRGKGRGTSH